MADYNGPAPMGSPCNTFGNEPLGTTTWALRTASSPSRRGNCSPEPDFWANIGGPDWPKGNGDQFMTGRAAQAMTAAPAARTSISTRGATTTSFEWGPRRRQARHPPDLRPGLRRSGGLLRGRTCRHGGQQQQLERLDQDRRHRPLQEAGIGSDEPVLHRRRGLDERPYRDVVRSPRPTRLPCHPGAPSRMRRQSRDTAPGPGDKYALSKGTQCLQGRPGEGLPPVGHAVHVHAARWGSTISRSAPTSPQRHRLRGGHQREPEDLLPDDRRRGREGHLVNSFALRAYSATGGLSVSAWKSMRIFVNGASATTTFNLVRVIPAASGNTLGTSGSSTSARVRRPARR